MNAATEAHRRTEELEVAMATPFAVSKDRAQAVKEAKQTVAELAILDPRLRPALHAEGVTDEEILQVQNSVRLGDPNSAVTDEMVELFGIAGTPEYCVEKIAALRKMGITQVAVGRPARESRDMIKMIGEQIIPQLR